MTAPKPAHPWYCRECSASGTTTPTKSDVGGKNSTAVRHCDDERHGIHVSGMPQGWRERRAG